MEASITSDKSTSTPNWKPLTSLSNPGLYLVKNTSTSTPYLGFYPGVGNHILCIDHRGVPGCWYRDGGGDFRPLEPDEEVTFTAKG